MTLALIVFILFPSPKVATLDAHRMAESIRMVENSGWRQRGRDGEWGAFQIMPNVWQRHSRARQWNAPEWEQRRVALAHLADLRAGLRRNGMPESPYLLGLCWNAGLDAAVRHSAPARAKDYAIRCQNIYEDQP
ncbi:MAG: hypothetical protein KKA68_21100 [Gammaproteobacteria bacterium]|nr:hypothetical protein [Gammaproteobacteria bacterium]